MRSAHRTRAKWFGDGTEIPTDEGKLHLVGRLPADGHHPVDGPARSALDNAVIESWHSTLEFELRSVEHFTTRAAARARVAAWIEDYNTNRWHSACQMTSPVNYERALAAGEAA